MEKYLKDFKEYEKYLSDSEYEEAKSRYIQLMEEEDVSEDNREHCFIRIFPVIAIYEALGGKESKEAFERTKELFYKVKVYPGSKFMKKIFKIPYIYKLVPKMAYRTIKKGYKESEDGFEIEFIECSKDVLRADFKNCTYFNYCKKLGVPELCDIFCTSDEIAAEAMKPHVIFERKGTLGRGAEKCDFCYRIKKNED